MHNLINSYFICHSKNLLRTPPCPDFLTSVMTPAFIELGRDTSLVIGHSSLLKSSAPRTLSSDQITLLGFVPRACIEETFSQLGFESEWCLFLFFIALLSFFFWFPRLLRNLRCHFHPRKRTTFDWILAIYIQQGIKNAQNCYWALTQKIIGIGMLRTKGLSCSSGAGPWINIDYNYTSFSISNLIKFIDIILSRKSRLYIE